MPYGLDPGSTPGGWNPPLKKTAWDAYQWNPPEYMSNEHPVLDPDASEKPTWQEIIAVIELAQLPIIRKRRLRELRRECQKRISIAYGETVLEDEILKRLRNGHTAEQDTERDRLRAKHTTIKSTIETMNYSTLNSFDPTLDSLWSA